MQERMRRVVGGPARSAPVDVRRSVPRVGRVDDPMEHEADRVADDVVARMMSRRASDDERWIGSSTRIAPMTSPVIRRGASTEVVRRVPYLHDAATRTYRDTTRGEDALAYLGKPKAFERDIFIEYGAVDEVNRIIATIADEQPAGGPVRRTRAGARSAPDEPYDTRGARALARKPGGFGTDLGSRRMSVTQELESRLPSTRTGPGRGGPEAAARARDAHKSQRARQLKSALGPVMAWLGGDDYEDMSGQIDGPKVATLIMIVAEQGPTTLAGGAGSRLPEAMGTIYTGGPIPRDRIFEILGVAEDAQGGFHNVKTEALGPGKYVKKRDELMAGGASLNRFEYAPAGIWMFYVSDVPVGLGANRRIRIDRRNYTPEELAALDAQRDAATIAAMHRSFATLTVTSQSWIPGTLLQASAGRETGQNEAMNHWSALGAAAYANRFLGTNVDLGQNWEWLHVRGAQIGGATINGNLVPGLFTANSAMIPYEARIKDWAIEDPLHFEAQFSIQGQRGVFVDKIVLSIRGVVKDRPDEPSPDGRVVRRGHKSLGAQERVLLEFDPLHGRVVDKMGNLFQRRAVDMVGTADTSAAMVV